MLVGFNYPWPANRYITIGPNIHEKGLPHPWRRDGTIARNLATLRAAGISVVRIWLLADGRNYDGHVVTGFDPKRGHYQDFDPPTRLHTSFVDDFAALLAIFRAADMKMIPVLVDFAFFDEPATYLGAGQNRLPTHGDYGRGRRSIAFYGPYRTLFVDGTVTPLAEVAAAHLDVVYAFDLMNEPYWCVSRLPGGPFGRRIERPAMAGFLRACDQAVRACGVPTTIGHRYYGDLAGEFGDEGVTNPQFHFYANLNPLDRLKFDAVRGTRPLLGEFGAITAGELAELRKRVSAADYKGMALTEHSWYDLHDRDAKPHEILPARLDHLSRSGCPLAMIWPDHIPADQTRDDLKLSAVKLASITHWRR